MSLANFGAFAIGAVMLLVGFMAVAATYPTVSLSGQLLVQPLFNRIENLTLTALLD